MNRITTGRVLIGLSLTLGTIGSTVIDNFPQPIGHMSAVRTWPPHALFHDAAFFLLLDGITAICLWLLFRRSREPMLGALIATLVVFVYWTPFFYITTLYPQASLVPTSPVGMPVQAIQFRSVGLCDPKRDPCDPRPSDPCPNPCGGGLDEHRVGRILALPKGNASWRS